MRAKILLIGVASLLTVQSPLLIAQETSEKAKEFSIDELGKYVEKLDREYKFEVRTELMGMDILIHYFETVKAAHENSGLANQPIKVVLPLYLLGSVSVLGLYEGAGAVMTKYSSDKSSWAKEYRQAKLEQSFRIKLATKENATPEAAANLAKATQAVEKLEATRPKFYKVGRTLRGAANLFKLGGLAVAGAALTEGIVLTYGPEEFNKTLSAFKDIEKRLEAQL